MRTCQSCYHNYIHNQCRYPSKNRPVQVQEKKGVVFVTRTVHDCKLLYRSSERKGENEKVDDLHRKGIVV